jgi:peptidoglycan L-alanyl-D-glutamate endopeptidase CwlK
MNKLDGLLPEFRAKIEVILDELKQQGIRCLITSARRTIAEQDKIYQTGRSTPGKIISNAQGTASPHVWGCAIDLCPLDSNGDCDWDAPDDVWHVIAITARKHGLQSGYDWTAFKDMPHIQDPKWKEQLALWKEGKIQAA